jgi:acyl dehydratase
MTVEVLSIDKMKERVGQEIGVTDWLKIDQDRINKFADCTLDRQWIHIDEEMAAKGPFGKTIAHGFLTVSLLSYFSEKYAIIPKGTKMTVNYGMNKLRLINPVPVDSKIRDRLTKMLSQDTLKMQMDNLPGSRSSAVRYTVIRGT